MTTYPVSRRFPEYINERRWCRNGQAPDARFIARAGAAINHLVAYRRNTIMEKCLDVRDIPAGSASSLEHWHCGTHVGHGVKKIVAIVTLAKADNVAGQDPYVTLAVRDGFSGGSVTASSELHYGGGAASPSDTPDEFLWGGQLSVDVTEDTDYRIWFRLYNYVRLVSACVFEWGEIPVDDTNGGTVSLGFGDGSAVTNTEQLDYLRACTQLWQGNGCQVFNWTADSAARAPGVPTGGTTFLNVFDWSSSTVTANTPGCRVNLQYHNTANQSTVPVKVAFRAERTAGGAGAANVFRITDGTNHIVSPEVSTDGWYTVTGTMPATAAQKWDIQGKAEVGATLRLDAACVFEDQ